MRAIRLSLSVASLLPSVAFAQVLGRDVEVFTRNEAIARGESFRFYSPIGDITVTEGTGTQVEVRAEKILRQGRASDIGFKVSRAGGAVTICAVFDDDDTCDEDGYRSDRRNWGRNYRPPSLAVTIRVPAGVRLSTKSGNGDVSVSGAYAEAIAGSGNGKVRVSGTAGEVEASSGNGEVTVENVRGPVTANSGNGDIRVTTVQGPVSASSGNGDLLVRMTELKAADDMQFTTGNGRIEVTVPEGFNADIDASTANGGIRTDFPIQVSGRISKTRLRGTIGQGGRRIRMVTGNGEIELRRG
jgi:putative adhesin